LKIKQLNIDTEDQPQLAFIGDYWDDVIVFEVVALFKEYANMFPQSFTKIKGIEGELSEMRIELKPKAKPIKKSSYRLSPHIKERMKEEIGKMIAAGLIFSVEESN
jgi:hypothetical protein